ncbi:MAG: malto-oligosyltrehalose synthase [Actinomycetota bacterium]|nr:malto-oligosyltrehalose synthase [Actinomycetota bacterium]
MSDRVVTAAPAVRATYRIQLHPGFGFDDAAEVVPYLAGLGISHLYCSPYLQARAGSRHGYDVVDHSRLNEELGGVEAHKRLLAALAEHGMGHILDVVPNHMAINDPANAWWWDILRHGPHSRYAAFFDIDWDPPEDKLRRKILVPILGDHYGRILDAGELQLEQVGDTPVVRYHEHTLPLAPGTEPGDIESANADAEVLHDTLELQHYRLARWRVASEELNYRRFFAINDLAALRAENPEVFRQTHALVLDLVDEGELQGLRVDHIDGLRRPEEYLRNLRAAAPGVYVVVEKILERDETLPNWPVEGTTGYDFLNRVSGLFVDPEGAGALTSVYEVFTGDVVELDEQRRNKKLAIADTELASDIERLTDLLSEICEQHRRFRDFTRRELRVALVETIAAFPVYRTYVNPSTHTVFETDARTISGAVERAASRCPELEPELFDLLRAILVLEIDRPAENNLAMRFQQVTGPVMAKGVEDTLFYTYNRLSSLNEVGGDPGNIGVSLDEFHELTQRSQRDWPLSLLATSTHDTKRSEDMRVRIHLLSQIPDEWATAVGRWTEMNMHHRGAGSAGPQNERGAGSAGPQNERGAGSAGPQNERGAGSAGPQNKRAGNMPSRGDEYLLYQTLIGAWPIDTARAKEYMTKAAKEAKLHTSWIAPDESYDAALESFVDAVLADDAFVGEIEEFVAPLVEPGRVASLSQTLIKLTAPGVPDIYQGCECWDLSLVDPDNRRPVDFHRRSALLQSIKRRDPKGAEDEPKLRVIERALALRSRRPELFGERATYEPLRAQGPKRERVVAFVRSSEVVTVAPRLTFGLGAMSGTTIELPAGFWSDQFTGRRYGGETELAELWRDFPVCLLTKDDE